MDHMVHGYVIEDYTDGFKRRLEKKRTKINKTFFAFVQLRDLLRDSKK